jgi:uncharacterized protein (DUF305 family)
MRLSAIAILSLISTVGLGATGFQGDKAAMPMPQTDGEYVHMMSMHHDEGIKMAELAVQKASDTAVKQFAARVRDGQQKERKELEALSKAAKVGTPQHSMKPMPMNHLETTTGREFDRMFLTMMRDHHSDAVKMSRQAKLTAAPVKNFAQRTAANQEKEIKEIAAMLKRIG